MTAPEWLPVEEKDCKRCDGPGGEVTYANQVPMPIRRRVEGIDWCIARLVAALNAAGIRTTASCCGHEVSPGMVLLDDDRVIAVFESREAARMVWPSLKA